jgi:vacuolar-type H+-ATPase subunit I/STV1
MGALLYFGLKFLAYTAWCFFGLCQFRADQQSCFTRSLVFGFLRLLLGFFFGVLIFIASMAMIAALGSSLSQNVATYLLVYVPVRWIEWAIMAVLIVPNSASFSAWAMGTSTKDRLWRFGGIAISCLADIPVIASLGGVVPVGRFLC